MTTTILTLDESIERMKQEIIDDIKAGRAPTDCPSFSALHSYVDANCYGGIAPAFGIDSGHIVCAVQKLSTKFLPSFRDAND